MKRTIFFSTTMILAMVGLLVISCSKNEDLIDDSKITALDVELTQDDAAADDVYEEIDATVETEALSLDLGSYQPQSTKSADEVFICKVVTVDHPDSTVFPKVITIDFGTGCSVVLPNGDTITKAGKIIITLTNRFFVPGAQRIITFEDFYVNNIKIEGTRTITFVGINDDGLLEYDILLEDGQLTFPGGYIYTREAEITREWYRAPDPLDDTIYVNGSMWGVNVYGENYSRDIIEELVLIHCPDFRHRWTIVEGQVLAIVGEAERLIDYGDDGCDGLAQVNCNGETHQIRIRERIRNRTGGNIGGN